MNLLRHVCMQNKDDNKPIKDDTNDCDGIMAKSKQVAICAPSCSAVQFWTGVDGAFVELYECQRVIVCALVGKCVRVGNMTTGLHKD